MALTITKSTKLFLASACLLLLTGPAVAAARSDLSRAIETYRLGNYKEAVISLSRLTDENPAEVEAHYYLANSLAYLGYYADAVEEYRTSLHLDPYGKLSGYSQLGLRRFEALARETENLAPAARPPETADEYRSARQMVGCIRRQIADAKQRVRTGGAQTANSKMRQAESSAQSIQSLAREEEADLRAMTGNRLSPLGQAIVFDIQHEAARRSNYVRQDAQVEARKHMIASVEHAKALELSAENLERLMLQTSGSGVRLQPAGTNLYVRNYDYVQPEALVARAQRLNPPYSFVRR